jgi:hypothetical protein
MRHLKTTPDREIETATLRIAGLVGDRCCNSVRSALCAIPGVLGAEICVAEGECRVTFDPRLAIPRQLRVAVGAVGCRVELIVLGGEENLWSEATAQARVPSRSGTPHHQIAGNDADLATYYG